MSNDFKDMLAELDSDQRKRDAKRTECRLCGTNRPKFNTFDQWKEIGYRVSRGQKAHHMTSEGAVFEKCQVEDMDDPNPEPREPKEPWDWRKHAF